MENKTFKGKEMNDFEEKLGKLTYISESITKAIEDSVKYIKKEKDPVSGNIPAQGLVVINDICFSDIKTLLNKDKDKLYKDKYSKLMSLSGINEDALDKLRVIYEKITDGDPVNATKEQQGELSAICDKFFEKAQILLKEI